MSFVTSRNFILPNSRDGIGKDCWFNLWTKKLWPYKELQIGDTLYWYESPSKRIVWKTRVIDVVRFSYKRKTEVEEKLNLTPVQAAQDYFVNGPESGYCHAYHSGSN